VHRLLVIDIVGKLNVCQIEAMSCIVLYILNVKRIFVCTVLVHNFSVKECQLTPLFRKLARLYLGIR